MLEIAVNQCLRGTLLSDAGRAEYLRRKGLTEFDFSTLDRTDKDLIAMLQENREVFGGHCSHVAIIEIPDNMPWKLFNEGNYEWIALGDDFVP